MDEPDESGRTALMYCAISDQLECLQLLLNRGAVISTKDASGQTAMHWAAATVSWGGEGGEPRRRGWGGRKRRRTFLIKYLLSLLYLSDLSTCIMHFLHRVTTSP